MSIFSFFKNEKDSVALLLDIGNGSITGAISVFRKNDKPEILYSLEVPFIISEKPNASKLVEDMAGLLTSLLQETMKQGWRHKYWQGRRKRFDGALVTFSSPWFVSKTKHLNLSKENSFVISKSFIDDVILNEENAFKKEIGVGDGGENSFDLVEKSIVHTKINGYTLESSIGKKTKSLDAFLYMSMVSSGIINKVESIVFTFAHVPKEKVLIHTFPLVSFTVIRDIFSSSSDFIMIDVTGEVTDLTLVQDDVIKQSVSIPSGRNFVVRQIMKSLGVSSEIAQSTLNLYKDGKLGETDIEKLEMVFTDVEKEWSIYLENGLSELSPQMVLPGNVYLTADDDVSNIYLNFLTLPKTDSTAMFRKGLTINHLNKESTAGLFTADSTVKTNEFAVLLAIFYKRIING